jgi:hypothetical protein
MRFVLLGIAMTVLCACTMTGGPLRPRLTATDYVEARLTFVAALRSRAGQDAIDCGIELEADLRRDRTSVSPATVCVRDAWESRTPFFVMRESRLYCPQFEGYAGDSSGKVVVLSGCPDRDFDMHLPEEIEESICDEYGPPTRSIHDGPCSLLDRI